MFIVKFVLQLSEGYIRKTENIDTFDKWLKQVARSKCREYWRNEQKHREITAIAEEQHAASLEQVLLRAQRKDEVSEVIDEMKPIYRNVAEMWLQGWTSAEIGMALGIPENTVKSRKRKIIKMLRQHFGVFLSHK